MSAEQIKPCPFCGNKDLNCYPLNYGGGHWVIRCDSENCFVKPFATLASTKPAAIALWNRRA